MMSYCLKNCICIYLAFILAVSPLRFAVADGICVDTNAVDYVTVLLQSTPVVVLQGYEQSGYHDSQNEKEYESTGHQDHDAPHCTPGHVCPAIVGMESVSQAHVRQARTPSYFRTLCFPLVVFLPFKPPCA